MFSDVEILVLKDRDMASGKDTTEADRQMYLSNNPQNHRVLNRFEIENYLYDKEVLKKYCEINEKTFDEAAYMLRSRWRKFHSSAIPLKQKKTGVLLLDKQQIWW